MSKKPKAYYSTARCQHCGQYIGQVITTLPDVLQIAGFWVSEIKAQCINCGTTFEFPFQNGKKSGSHAIIKVKETKQ